MNVDTEFLPRAGDLVELKAGGPALVVRSVEDDVVTVDWFDKATARSAKFRLAQLRTHTPDKPYLIVMGGVDLSKSQQERS